MQQHKLRSIQFAETMTPRNIRISEARRYLFISWT